MRKTFLGQVKGSQEAQIGQKVDFLFDDLAFLWSKSFSVIFPQLFVFFSHLAVQYSELIWGCEVLRITQVLKAFKGISAVNAQNTMLREKLYCIRAC